MGAVTRRTPKPMLRVHGRPIVEHTLLRLREAGVRRAVVVTGYLGERVRRHLGTGEQIGLEIAYRHQERPEGTGAALLLAADAVDEEPFLVAWGDVLIDPPFYPQFAAAYRGQPCDVLLAVNQVWDPWRGAAVYLDEQRRVVRLVEKPARGTSTTRWNNSGLFVLRPWVLDLVRELRPSSRGEIEFPQAVAAAVERGADVRALPILGFWSDVGTPADLITARRDYTG